MKTQVNSDRTVAVDAKLTRFVKSEVDRILRNFDGRLTRVEVHLSDVNNVKTGVADKRCLVETRPAGARPRSTSATADRFDEAIGTALRRMQRSLTSFFGRQADAKKARTPRAAAVMARAAARVSSTPPPAAVKTSPRKATPTKAAPKTASAKKAAGEKAAGKKAAAPRPAAAGKKATGKAAAKKTTPRKAAAKQAVAPEVELTGRGPKKKRIYQARRKAWPVR